MRVMIQYVMVRKKALTNILLNSSYLLQAYRHGKKWFCETITPFHTHIVAGT
jgi:hypothetical protein